MPLLPFTSTPIEIAVTDRVIAETIIQQKVRFVSLRHVQSNGRSSAYITVQVHMYASGTDYAIELMGQGFNSYTTELVADNNTIVNAADGAILAIRNGEPDTAWVEKAEAFTENVMFQGDFFELLRDTQSIKIGDMIRLHITQADAMGRFSA